MKQDAAREQRIADDIIVDANGSEEQALGWYYYLQGALQFPFSARCRVTRTMSPLKVGERVTVTGMPPEEECEREMFVQIRWNNRRLAVPLAQLGVNSPPEVDAATREAVGDWHYWVDRGYEF